MKIGVLGWGSLVWDPGDLRIAGEFQPGGPELPLEFSRISRDGRLTLVIDPAHGEVCRARFATSRLRSVADAADDLMARECAKSPNAIGLVDLPAQYRRSRHAEIGDAVAAWCGAAGFDAAVWTDLASNFDEAHGEPFSVDAAVAYLTGLDAATLHRAREYFSRAPREVDTPLRRGVASEMPQAAP